jgi:type III secretory pathway component EscS
MIILAFVLAIIVLGSIIAFLIGLYKVLFQKKEKEFGIKLLINSTIIFIVGFGTCAAILNNSGI